MTKIIIMTINRKHDKVITVCNININNKTSTPSWDSV